MRLRVKFGIITEIRLIENKIFLVRSVASPILPINVGITLITRGRHQVRNLIPSIGEVIHIGIRIGILVPVTSVTIIMTTITGPTIRSIFVKLKVWMLIKGRLSLVLLILHRKFYPVRIVRALVISHSQGCRQRLVP